MFEVFVESEKIQEGEVAVIGMSDRFNELAQNVAKDTIKNGLSLKNEMTSFVKNAIDEVNDEGSFQIAMPVVVKSLENRKVTKTVITKET